jgi:D-alanine transaminase
MLAKLESGSSQSVSLNGVWSPIEDAKVSVLDRGFIFGDGIYEVVPVYGGRLFRWPQHLARLKRSLSKVGIPNPHQDYAWTALVKELVLRHAWANQLVYIQITRGVAKRDHAFPKVMVPTVFAMSSEMLPASSDARQNGVAVISLEDERWLHCDIKSTSLLGNVLARQASVEAEAAECIMFRDGFMTEGSSSNVWIVRDEVVFGPPLDHLVLEGIRVGLMAELAEACGARLEMRRITRDEVFNADEILISSATKEVLAVKSLDGHPVGRGDSAGRPGPMYTKLYSAYQLAKAAGSN